MRALSAPELLRVWEQGLAQLSSQRALTLLATACAEMSPDALAKFSIGQRDARLLTLREWTFGSQMVSLTICPSCHERLELTFNVADLRVMPEVELTETFSLSVAGYEIGFRLPNSEDLAAAVIDEDPTTARQLLFELCLSTVLCNGIQVPASQLPAEVVNAVVERMAQADPQADIQLALVCPRCNHQWRTPFDIGSFFWSEIHAWANRVLNEVHRLASAYGWRETDILSMSPWRRNFYLSLVGR